MIIIDDRRIYSLSWRRNKHVQWRYSEYAGRYASIEECKKEAAERLPKGTDCTIDDGFTTVERFTV